VARRRRPVPQRPPQGQRAGPCGWNLLRYTWHSLDGQPKETVAEIHEMLTLGA
jgi:hypothetical protein